MYRQQAERLAGKLRLQRPDLAVEVYQDGIRGCRWLVNTYDPRTDRTMVFETKHEAMDAIAAVRETSAGRG